MIPDPAWQWQDANGTFLCVHPHEYVSIQWSALLDGQFAAGPVGRHVAVERRARLEDVERHAMLDHLPQHVRVLGGDVVRDQRFAHHDAEP